MYDQQKVNKWNFFCKYTARSSRGQPMSVTKRTAGGETEYPLGK